MTAASADGEGYVFGNAWERERERLARLAAGFDAATFSHLARLGVAPGWQCLEVGAGEGSVARWLAARVAPSGAVLATDIDPRFVEAAPNLEVVRHDVTRDPFPEKTFGLAHCRLVLEHLPGRGPALERLAASLRPGGWLLVEDFDWSSAAPASAHGAEIITRTIAAAMDLMSRAGYDLHYGRRLPDELDRVGLVDIGAEGRVSLLRGGTAEVEWFRMSVERLRDPLLACGGLGEGEIGELFDLLDDRSFCFFSPVMVSAWARRP